MKSWSGSYTVAMVTIHTSYESDLRCTSTHEPSGTKISTDAPKDNQGRGESFSPTDMVATALCSCAMTIMGIKGQREGIDLRGMTGRVVKGMAADPRRISSTPVEFTIPGNLDSEQRELLENAARSCPVAKSLHPDIDAVMTFCYAE